MPRHISKINQPQGYNIYPYYPLGDQKIFDGYSSLCDYIVEQKTVVIDGYVGALWDRLITSLTEELISRQLSVNIIDTASFFKSEVALDAMIAPFLGAADSVWGRKTTLTLSDYFDTAALNEVKKDSTADINMVIGCGASLANWNASLIYVDLPKN